MSYTSLKILAGTQYKWDFVSKSISSSYIGGSYEMSRPITELVDAYNTGTTMRKIYHNGSGGITIVYVTNTIVFYFKDPSGFIADLYYYSIASKSVTHETIYYTFFNNPNYSKLNTDLVDSYCAGTTLKQVYHNGSGGVTNVLSPNSTTCGFVAPTNGLTVTETLTVKLDKSCRANPVFLKWRNTLGGWDQWLFDTTQTEKLHTKSLGSYNLNFTYVDTTDAISQSRGKDAKPSMIIGADQLTNDELEGLKDVLFSPQVYMIAADLSQKVVEVIEGTFSIKETRDTLHSIEFEILLPNTYTVTQ